MKRRFLLVSALVLVSCSSGGAEPDTAGFGPPSVQPEVVTRHSEQFANDLPQRPAGSQEELAAATYILGHLQRSGYVPLLEAVPVGNLVRSTNVVAAPTGGAEPAVVVAVGYDTPPGISDDGVEIGLFLELARALQVAAPDHEVEFVALGAEHSKDGPRGARRLAESLADDDGDVLVITFSDVTLAGRGFGASGPGAEDLTALAGDAPAAEVTSEGPDPFAEADLDHVVVSGGATDVGDVLLEYLSGRSAARGGLGRTADR